MAKKPTAAQIAARKKFVAAVRAGKFRKPKKGKAAKVSRKLKAVKKTVVVSVRRANGSPRYKKVKRKTATVNSLKANIRQKLNDQLKEQLFKRDRATSYKQHRAAQLKIDNIRRGLRGLK